MRLITLAESINITGATLNFQGTRIEVPNHFDIPHNEYVLIEQTFQKMIDKEMNFYQAAQFLKEQHICKYDVTNYLNTLISQKS